MMKNIDLSRGFEVIRMSKKGATVLETFSTYEAAWRYAATKRNVIVRYWGKTEN